MQDEETSPPAAWPPRLSTVLSLVAIGCAVWVASAWIPDPPDNTCGSVWRTDIWWGRDTCGPTMTVRGVASLGLVALAIDLYLVAWGVRASSRWWRRAAPWVVLLCSCAAFIQTHAAWQGGGL